MADTKGKKKTTPPPQTKNTDIVAGGSSVGGLLPSEALGTNVTQVEASLQKNYHSIWAFWMTTPGLRPIFEQALQDGTLAGIQQGSKAAQDKFSMALQPWIANNGISFFQKAVAESTDPGYQTKVDNRQQSVRDMLTTMGYGSLANDPATLKSITDASLSQDFDSTIFSSQAGQDRLRHLISVTAASQKANITGGTGADLRSQLMDYNMQQGSPFSQAMIDDAVTKIVDPTSGADFNTYKTMIRDKASNNYSGFKPLIDQGVTVQQIADPYISSLTRLLELPYNSSNYNEYLNPGSKYYSLLQKGLANSIDPSTGQTQPMPIWQFEQQVRQDPAWQQTNNARDYYSGIVHQIGKDFGFVS
jgi:hypothetical protein